MVGEIITNFITCTQVLQHSVDFAEYIDVGTMTELGEIEIKNGNVED